LERLGIHQFVETAQSGNRSAGWCHQHFPNQATALGSAGALARERSGEWAVFQSNIPGETAKWCIHAREIARTSVTTRLDIFEESESFTPRDRTRSLREMAQGIHLAKVTYDKWIRNTKTFLGYKLAEQRKPAAFMDK
jgi:hypothetical protein